MATKFASPKDQVVKSSNGQYLLHINAESGLHEVREGANVLWSFKKDLWHNDYVVSDDGKHVLWVSWSYMKAEDLGKEALAIYSAGGVVLKKTFAELGAPRPYKKDEIGPVGEFWRIWRGSITQKGQVITIPVEGRDKPFEIDLSKIEELRKAEGGAGQLPVRP